MTILTRIGHCAECAKIQSPKSGQLFLVHGSTSNRYRVLEAERNGKIGFVPHIYKLEKVLGENVITLKSCSMYGCGVDRKPEENTWFYFVKDWKREVWAIKDWNALVELKHNWFTYGYEI